MRIIKNEYETIINATYTIVICGNNQFSRNRIIILKATAAYKKNLTM